MASFLECGTAFGTISVNLDRVNYIAPNNDGAIIYFSGDKDSSCVHVNVGIPELMRLWMANNA